MQVKSDSVSLYVVEEQEIYREIYNCILPKHANIDVLRVSGSGEKGSMLRAVTELLPSVMLLSVKKLNKDMIRAGKNQRQLSQDGNCDIDCILQLTGY